MKLALNHLNKSALSVLLFTCVYHVFSQLLNGSFFISLFFLCAAIVSGRTLINEQKSTKKQHSSNNRNDLYKYALCSSWLALFSLLFTAENQWSMFAVWFSILILCTSILLQPIHARRFNVIALSIYWAFSLLLTQQSFLFIESALALTIILYLASVIQTLIYDLEAKLNLSEETDKLTGCIQPSTFKHELDKVAQLYDRYATPFSLICIKYQSHFSTENDLQTWLKELAHLYQSRLRKTDVLCRFNTQRFMILLPSTNNENAEVLTQDLKNCVKAYEFSFKALPSDGPTLSFSTETFLKDENIEDWFRNIQSR